MSSLPIGRQSGGNRTRTDHFQHSGFRAVHHAGAFSGGEALYYGLNALSNNMIMRICTIIRQAQAQMRLRGSRQWQNGYPAAHI